MENPWKQLIEEISNPRDIAAAAGGAAVGSIGTFLTGGADFGTSAAAGALVAVSARKAYVAGTRRKKMIKSMKSLGDLINESIENENDPDSSNTCELIKLLAIVKIALKLFEKKVIGEEKFQDKISDYADQYEKICSGLGRYVSRN